MLTRTNFRKRNFLFRNQISALNNFIIVEDLWCKLRCADINRYNYEISGTLREEQKHTTNLETCFSDQVVIFGRMQKTNSIIT